MLLIDFDKQNIATETLNKTKKQFNRKYMHTSLSDVDFWFSPVPVVLDQTALTAVLTLFISSLIMASTQRPISQTTLYRFKSKGSST